MFLTVSYNKIRIFFSPIKFDMGVIPSVQVLFKIPCETGNHTPEFAECAKSKSAHDECFRIAKAVTATALGIVSG